VCGIGRAPSASGLFRRSKFWISMAWARGEAQSFVDPDKKGEDGEAAVEEDADAQHGSGHLFFRPRRLSSATELGRRDIGRAHDRPVRQKLPSVPPLLPLGWGRPVRRGGLEVWTGGTP
jgi:hypothetical protein